MRRMILYGVIIFQIALIVSLVRGIQQSRQSVSRIASLETTKKKLEEEQRKLKAEGEYVQSDYYLEKVARDELHLAKPGEMVVVIPDSQKVEGGENPQTQESGEKPNWQKWWGVLSGDD